MTKEALIAELQTLSEEEQHEVIRALYEDDKPEPGPWKALSEEYRAYCDRESYYVSSRTKDME